MRADDAFVEWLRELLEPIGRVGVRRMFGAHGLYLDGMFIAVVDDGRLYLKADAETEKHFRAAGCAPFVFTAEGREIATSYWSVPESALDCAEDMEPWARRAMAAAQRKQERKPKQPKKRAAEPTPKVPATRARSAASASTARSAPRR